MTISTTIDAKKVTPKTAVKRGAAKLPMSEFAEKSLFIDGEPFRFVGRHYLRRIYDEVRPFAMMKCGRGVEKSTTLCSRLLTFGMKFPYFRNLYVSASRQQALDFSRDQLDQRLQSPWLRERHFDPRTCDNNVELKTLTNGSRIRLRNVYNTPDRVRGLRADQLLIDEIQDVQSRFLAIIEEVLVQSKFSLKLYSGTPKTFDNHIEHLWRGTTMEEWEVKCPACWKWQEKGLDITNIGKSGPLCRYCGAWIDVTVGRWVAYGSGDEGRRLGFRIPQLIIPFYQESERWRTEIISKLERYSLGQFNNEVLGISFDEADKPITEDDIKVACRGQWVDQFTKVVPRVPIFMGVDWGSGGQSKTVLVVGGFVSRHVFQVFYSHIFRPVEHPTMDDVLGEICRIALQWNCVAVGLDFGYGPMENMRLRPMLGDDVIWQFQNVNQQRADIMWNEKAGRFQHNYVQTLSQLFAAVKAGKFIFPTWNHWEPFATHMLAARKEYNWSTGYVSYINSPDSPDDALHALNYAYMAGKIFVHDWLQRDLSDASGRTKQVPMPHFLQPRRS